MAEFQGVLGMEIEGCTKRIIDKEMDVKEGRKIRPSKSLFNYLV